RLVPIPGREIQARLQALCARGVDELAHDVALTVAPGAGFHGMERDGAGPETESVMMLGGQDHPAEAARAGGPRPLTRIERAGVEQALGFVAHPPFTVREGVDAEVQEESQLVAMPGELRRRGKGKAWGLGQEGQTRPSRREAQGSGTGEEFSAAGQTPLRRLRRARVTITSPNTTITRPHHRSTSIPAVIQ